MILDDEDGQRASPPPDMSRLRGCWRRKREGDGEASPSGTQINESRIAKLEDFCKGPLFITRSLTSKTEMVQLLKSSRYPGIWCKGGSSSKAPDTK